MILNRYGELTPHPRLDENALFSMGYTLPEK